MLVHFHHFIFMDGYHFSRSLLQNHIFTVGLPNLKELLPVFWNSSNYKSTRQRGIPSNSRYWIFFFLTLTLCNAGDTLKIFLSVSISLKNFIDFFKTVLWTGELKQAIVSMMLRKDEIEEKNRYVWLSANCVFYIASKMILWILFLQPGFLAARWSTS